MADFSLDNIAKKLDSAQQYLNQSNDLTAGQEASYKTNGFALPAAYSADGNGLPFRKVPYQHAGKIRRNIITWFVPEFGVVRMYINPDNLVYNYKKIIHKEKTKNGYSLQYWGEDLTTLQISGTTGSSGVEGVNALYEIYRAEQYAFDSTALSIAANNASQNAATDLVNSGLGFLGKGIGGSAGALVAGGLSGVLGLTSADSNMASKDFTSLAELAFTVEMFYDGWVFRGFFENITITERTDLLFAYNINFTVTQKRGYRTNYFPWHRTPIMGASGFETPNSYNGGVSAT